MMFALLTLACLASLALSEPYPEDTVEEAAVAVDADEVSHGVEKRLFSAGYLGCFSDKGDRDLPKTFFSKDDQTPKLCISECFHAGYRYAGLQYAKECWCGNSYGKYGKGLCDMPCTGNPQLICGGFWANSVYTTRLHLNFQTACEGHGDDRISIQCPSGSNKKVDIHYAVYGRLDLCTCPSDHGNTVDCYAKGALTAVRHACQGKTSCSVHARDDGTFGVDPCPGVSKYLRVGYVCT